MKRPLLLSILFLPAFLLSQQNAVPGFTENKGQFTNEDRSSQVLFMSCGNGPRVFVTTEGLEFFFLQREKESSDPDSKTISHWSKIAMLLEGASIKKENISTEDPLPGLSNYYYSNCPAGIENVLSWHKVIIKNIYPGIDWKLTYDSKNGLAHDFVVHPGADISLIHPLYKGANENLLINAEKKLVLNSLYGTLFEGGLHVYEQASGKDVDCSVLLNLNGSISYNLIGNYDNSNTTIVIDPPLQWSMSQVSSDFDYGYAITAAQDASGDVLLTGATDGTNFPTLNAYQGVLSGVEDMVVVRLNSAGTRLWSTYYGGTGTEQGKGITSDANGNCYVTGNTSSTNFPTLNPVQSFNGGGTDVVVLKFNAAGVRQWATYYGAAGNDYGNALVSDASGNIYVTGYTNSQFFPVVAALQSTKAAVNDIFIMKMNSSSAVQWATFYGGDDDDKAKGITMDASATNIFITGSTLSTTFPNTLGSFQQSTGSFSIEDAFVLKLTTAQVLVFASYCGGNDADFGSGIAVDNSGNIFVTGYTLSTNFPIVNPGGNAYFDGTQASPAQEAFVMECNSSGTTRTWSSYIGGMGTDYAFAISYDPGIGIFICGNTASTDFPVQMPADNVYYQSVQGDGGNFNDMFIMWFGTNDSLRWSTYYGDASSNEAYGICNDANDNIFVTGVDNNDLAVLKFSSGISTVVCNCTPDITGTFLYPVPATQTLYLSIFSEKETNVKLEMIDAQGRCVMQENYFSSKGREAHTMDVSSLAKGTYLLRYTSENNSGVMKFVKE
ncbi:MAG: SBBP repeat-containing protein [Bacteroidetes bacterium]|nr:SBBP repeat-containing protein [Bacteroidota bacterium]